MINNHEIIELLRNGDEAAFKVVFQTYHSRLFFFAKEYVQDEAIVEHIIQDSFMTLWNKRETLDESSNLNAYLYTVTKNFCLKQLRKIKYDDKFRSKEIDRQDLVFNIEALEELQTSSLTFKEIESILHETIESLPPRCREVFELSRFEDLKNKEIAERLGITEKAVEANISRALKVLKVALRDYLPIIAYLLG
ncbi:RNA polymerase sigma-70 factor [Puteibacter caeruleilacunae]|nr:RNA polymerase sigma-70 factor [Puteibacter caeruleilacunae]